MSGKIPVTVIAGGQSSGKTALLNRLLASHAGAVDESSVVLTHPAGAVQLKGMRVSVLARGVVIQEGACLCCAVSGELVDALRNWFFAALHRKTAPFSRVLIETADGDDPASIMYTLQYDAFLRDRYVYGGCATVIDAAEGVHGLQEQPIMLRQAVLANALVISQAASVSETALAGLDACLLAVNPDAPVFRSDDAQALDFLLSAALADSGLPGLPRGALAAARPSLWNTGGLGRRAHRIRRAAVDPWVMPLAGEAPSGIRVLTVRWSAPLVRSALMRALERLQEDVSTPLLQVRGVVQFEGDVRAWRVNGVHGQRYPLEALCRDVRHPAAAGARSDLAPGKSVMVMVFQGDRLAGFPDNVLSVLPENAEMMSPVNNLPG